MNETSARAVHHSNRPYTAAIILASLFIPITILTGQVVEAIMDQANPAGLDDVSVGLAYLTEILIWSFTVLGVTVIGFLVATIIHFTRTRSFRSIALPVTIALIQLVIGVSALVLTQTISGIEG